MIGIMNQIRFVLSIGPSRESLIALAALAAVLAIQLIAAASAGRAIDASH
ncbi:MAG: hypothetical protein QW463_02750 [Candidatus Caldarchaeum sp.]